jgi:serine/threonine protein kinase
MSLSAPPPTHTIIAQRYELQRQLAQGGMAEVWLAVDMTLDRKVAVKWLKPTLATDAVVAERFRREAIAAASLNHPNIVAVHDVFEQDGRQAVVMQLVEGKSLRQLLDTQKRLSPELTCHIGSCVALALDHAHEAGFVHRDVKPGNIMITSDGRVLLTDFGIAKGLQSAEADLTSDNIMMGTAKYLSPEQVRGKKLDGRADLYSLGLVLYECLAGRVPFLGETDADTALARLQRDPTDLTSLRATLPTKLVAVIHQLLARNPANRPATGAELVEALREAAAQGPPIIDQTGTGRTPLLPFGAGRFRRAPSDGLERPGTKPIDEGAKRNERSARTTSNPTYQSITGIPGEVAGMVAIAGQSPAPTMSTATPPRPTRERTPPRGNDRTDDGAVAATARGLSHSWKPSMLVVGSLLLIALIVGSLLWFNLQYGGGDVVTSTTVLPADGAAPAAPTTPGPAVTGPATITAFTAFDPDGDGHENDADVSLAGADGNPATSWATVCYSSKFFGAKRGVGLVVSFDQPNTRALSVDVINAPYQLRFFGSAADVAPTDLAQWVQIGAKSYANNPATVVSDVPAAPIKHMLVLLNEVGADSTCTASNPYRGRLGEISLVG